MQLIPAAHINRVATITLMLSPDNCCTLTARTGSMVPGLSPTQRAWFFLQSGKKMTIELGKQSLSHCHLVIQLYFEML